MLVRRNALVLPVVALICAAPAMASHPADFAKAVAPCLKSGEMGPAEKMFLKGSKSSGRNQLLYLYELAGLYRLKGDFAKSLELFGTADQVAHEQESKAVVSVGGGVGQAGAVMTNDLVLPWEASCCDKVMARTLNALNYLAAQDLEGARVEVRKAEEYQSRERDKRQGKVAKAAQKDLKAAAAVPATPAPDAAAEAAPAAAPDAPAPAVHRPVPGSATARPALRSRLAAPAAGAPADPAATPAPAVELPAPEPEPELNQPVVASHYDAMFSYARQVRNSYENAFTYYLSSQVYATSGADSLDDALVDIKRAYKLAPNAPAVQTAYLDLLAQAGDNHALAKLKARLGGAADYQPADPASTGKVVVIFEAGFVPSLSELSLTLPFNGVLISLAFPIYKELEHPQPVLRVAAAGGTFETGRLVDLRAMEARALQERLPGIVTRATVGAAAKAAAQVEAKKQYGAFGQLAAALLTKAVTNADLRSWLSLPAEVQGAQFHLPAGHQDLTLSSYDWSEQVSLDVDPGSCTFVMVQGAPGCKVIKAVPLKAGA